MASISLHLDGEQRFIGAITEGECVAVALSSDLDVMGEKVARSRDWVTLHGSIADMRRFAEGILNALPKQREQPVSADSLRSILHLIASDLGIDDWGKSTNPVALAREIRR